jgi:hypothetical protein
MIFHQEVTTRLKNASEEAGFLAERLDIQLLSTEYCCYEMSDYSMSRAVIRRARKP